MKETATSRSADDQEGGEIMSAAAAVTAIIAITAITSEH